LVADRRELGGNGAHRVRVVVAAIAARISAGSRTSCDLAFGCRSNRFIPSRVKLIVLRVMGMAKS
jgi:hypothetical protein